MAEKAPERKVEAPRKGPSDVAAEQQKDLKGSVEGNALLTIGYKDGEWPRKEAERTNAITPEKGKTYTAMGGVNRLPFKQELRPYQWYLTMGEYARHMVRDFNRIDFQFPSYKNIPKNEKARQRIRDMVKKVSGASIDATIIDDPKKAAEAFKNVLDAVGNTNDIYGAEGVLNVVLAYGRASDTMRGVTPENAGSIDYKLELSNKRYAKLFEKKQKAEKKVDARPKESKLDLRTMPPKEYVVQKAKEMGSSEYKVYVEVTDQYLADRNKLEERAKLCYDRQQISSDDYVRLMQLLRSLKMNNPSSPPNENDYERLNHVAKVIENVTNEIHQAEKSRAAIKKEVSESRGVDIETVEFEKQAKLIINEGYLEFPKPPYPILKADTIEELVKRIAHDVVEAIYPAYNLPQQYERLIHNIIRGTLNAELKHSPNQSSPYKLSDAEKIRFIVPVLQEMERKPDPVKRNRR